MGLTTEGWTAAVCLKTLAVFALLVTPLYFVLRLFVRTVRQAYGFDLEPDDGPPLRVCFRCGNTVMEPEFANCPYCGAAISPDVDPHEP